MFHLVKCKPKQYFKKSEKQSATDIFIIRWDPPVTKWMIAWQDMTVASELLQFAANWPKITKIESSIILSNSVQGTESEFQAAL